MTEKGTEAGGLRRPYWMGIGRFPKLSIQNRMGGQKDLVKA